MQWWKGLGFSIFECMAVNKLLEFHEEYLKSMDNLYENGMTIDEVFKIMRG